MGPVSWAASEGRVLCAEKWVQPCNGCPWEDCSRQGNVRLDARGVSPYGEDQGGHHVESDLMLSISGRGRCLQLLLRVAASVE